jgi:predicted NBD/HSP70 family sugar kinase
MARPDATEQVVRTLTTTGPASRAELSRATGLAESTVSVAVADLVAVGLVAESQAPASPRRAGRPPVQVRMHRAAGLVLGVDLGKSHARVALADLGHTVLAERTVDVVVDQPATDQIAAIVALTDELLAGAAASRADLAGAAMGLPGPVHQRTARLGDSTILPGWVGVRAAEAMHDALGVAVTIDNDANLGALGEWTWGAARGADTAIYVKVSTGVGAGLIISGQPFVGAGGTAGEIGHTVLDPDGPPCRCGNRGCLEVLAGSRAVLRQAAASGDGEAGLREVIDDAIHGDPAAREAIEASGRAVGAALATLCNLINPERIVVGGALSAAGELLLEPLRAALAAGAIRSAAEDVEILAGELGERAQVMGALALALRGARPVAGRHRSPSR